VSETTVTTERRPRKDAQRNRTHILKIAEQYFAEHGMTGSMDGIAKRAGVGPPGCPPRCSAAGPRGRTGSALRHHPAGGDRRRRGACAVAGRARPVGLGLRRPARTTACRADRGHLPAFADLPGLHHHHRRVPAQRAKRRPRPRRRPGQGPLPRRAGHQLDPWRCHGRRVVGGSADDHDAGRLGGSEGPDLAPVTRRFLRKLVRRERFVLLDNRSQAL
jgi:hypothetical protein